MINKKISKNKDIIKKDKIKIILKIFASIIITFILSIIIGIIGFSIGRYIGKNDFFLEEIYSLTGFLFAYSLGILIISFFILKIFKINVYFKHSLFSFFIAYIILLISAFILKINQYQGIFLLEIIIIFPLLIVISLFYKKLLSYFKGLLYNK
jgi:hypothetical protein